MPSDSPAPGRQRRLWMGLAMVWFVFVNVIFYWHLYQTRSAELSVIWERLMGVFR